MRRVISIIYLLTLMLFGACIYLILKRFGVAYGFYDVVPSMSILTYIGLFLSFLITIALSNRVYLNDYDFEYHSGFGIYDKGYEVVGCNTVLLCLVALLTCLCYVIIN